MIDTSISMEKFLQNQRFKLVKGYLNGDVLDFGGNNGELAPFVEGDYTLVNYDHTPMENKTFDTIVLLAVVEHIEVKDVYSIFDKFKKCLRKSGTIFLTTPTPSSEPVLNLLASIGFLDKQNIEEHKHYWNKEDIVKLAQSAGFSIQDYGKFQLGFNQFAVLKHDA